MWDTSTIRELSDEAARKAASSDQRPYIPWNRKEIERYGVDKRFPFPNIGSYEPDGWDPVEKEDGSHLALFVDKTGVGLPTERALNVDQLRDRLLELYEENSSYGYAITEEGQFQFYIGVFLKTPVEDSKRDKQLEIIETTLAPWISFKDTSEPTADGDEPWPEKVFRWLEEDDPRALDIEDEGMPNLEPYKIVPKLTMLGLIPRRVLPALISLDLLDEDSEFVLRDVDVDGYRLQMWYCPDDFQLGIIKDSVYYRFTDPNGWVVFEDCDFRCSPICSLDSDEAVRSLLGFLTLRPGDTDKEYFERYTEAQLEWAESEAEELQMWTIEPEECGCAEEEPDTECKGCKGTGWFGAPPTWEVDGEKTFFKPWAKADSRQ